MKRVVTLSREHGSGGREIAVRVADALEWRVLDRLLIEEVARLARVPAADVAALDERVNPWTIRLAKGLWSGSADSFASTAGDTVFDADRMAELARRVIVDAADAGSCVILGRGAQFVLAGRDDVLRVFVHAPLAERLRRLRAGAVSETAAADELERVDRGRAAYVRHYFGRDRTDPSCYDLMVDSHLGLDVVARTILCAAGYRGEAT